MDNQKIYTKFSEVEAAIKAAGNKHVKLQDKAGKDIVPFNPAKTTPTSKITQIKTKLASLPAGIYCIVGQDRFGKNVHQDFYYFGKGKFSNDLSEAPAHRNNNTPAPANNNSDHLLSLDSAVTNIREAADLKAENIYLKKRNEELEKRVKDLEAENETLEAANEALNDESELEEEKSPFGGLSEFFKEISPMIPGITERYFGLQEKQIQFKQAELLVKNGYDLPGVKRSAGKSQQAKPTRMPEPGTAEWDDYIEEVMELSDEDFENHLELIRVKFPHLYQPLCDAVYTEAEEEEEGGEE